MLRNVLKCCMIVCEVSGLSILDAFVPETGDIGSVFVSVTDYGMTFSKGAVEALGYPAFVRVYFDKKGKRMAIVPCGEEAGARKFARGGDTPQPGFVRWNDRKLLDQVNTLGGLDTSGKGVRVMGEYVEDEHLLVFNLKQTIPVRAKG